MIIDLTPKLPTHVVFGSADSLNAAKSSFISNMPGWAVMQYGVEKFGVSAGLSYDFNLKTLSIYF
jgi:hypothetical protein